MKKILYSLSTAICLVLMLSCTKDLSPLTPDLPNGSLKDGVEITLRFPDMGTQNTRALGEADENTLSALDLFIFVFDGSNLLQTTHVLPSETEVADGSEGDEHDRKNGHIRFKTTLPQTDNDAIIHIVAVEEDNEKSFSKQIEAIGFGPEDIVMPALSVKDGQDAYWQRIELGCSIKQTVKKDDGSETPGTEKDIEAIFENPIPLIRNFAKITLVSSTDAFKVIGWTVVNDLNGGTVVPNFSKAGSSDVDFPDFRKWNGEDKTSYTIKNYADLIADGYQGVSLSGAGLRHTIDEVGGTDGGTDAGAGAGWTEAGVAMYLYERKYSTVNPLYILVYGEYVGSGASGNGVKKYYKLLLGEKDTDTGIVSDYNVIRNIHYTVNITAVHPDAGYSTPAEAATAPASNNISGDVVTKDMFSISDGIDMLYVNAINFIVTEPNTTIDFRYRYMTDISSSNTQNDDLVKYDFYKNDVERVGLPKPGEGVVVDSWEKTERQITDENNKNIKWSQIIITPKEPSEELRQESFYVFSQPATDANGTLGISRKINLILRKPWDYLRVGVFPGHWVDADQFPDFDYDKDNGGYPLVGAEKGAKLTLFLELPAGLPEAMFPLDFTIESNRQNIENAGAGNAVVDMGPSLWPDVSETRIKYIKTITWSEYAPNGETSTASSRVIRIRLNTITAISSLGSADAILSTIRIYNKYFNLTETEFMRDKGQTVTPPKNSVKTEIFTETVIETTAEPFNVIWDFSDSSWDAAANRVPVSNFTSGAINGKDENGEEAVINVNTITTVSHVTRITKTVGSEVTVEERRELISKNETNESKYFGLTISNGNNTTNTSYMINVGYDDTGTQTGRYFLTNRDYNNFVLDAFAVATPAGANVDEEENISLKITAAGNVTTVTPSFTVGNGLSVANTGQSFATNKQTNTYTISAGSGNTKTITINPANNNLGNRQYIRFYRFELVGPYHKKTTAIDMEFEDTVSTD